MLSKYVKSDLYRYGSGVSFRAFIRHYFISPGFKYSFFWRICKHFKNRNKPAYFLFRLVLRHYSYKYGFDIPVDTSIGFGFYIGHFGNVVISSKAVLGNNCNVSQGVTIGYSPRGKYKGYPTIGNNVFIGPGAVIIGSIEIGDDVGIGANSVVTKSFGQGLIVAGIPAVEVSSNGNDGYIINKWEIPNKL